MPLALPVTDGSLGEVEKRNPLSVCLSHGKHSKQPKDVSFGAVSHP